MMKTFNVSKPTKSGVHFEYKLKTYIIATFKGFIGIYQCKILSCGDVLALNQDGRESVLINFNFIFLIKNKYDNATNKKTRKKKRRSERSDKSAVAGITLVPIGEDVVRVGRAHDGRDDGLLDPARFGDGRRRKAAPQLGRRVGERIGNEHERQCAALLR